MSGTIAHPLALGADRAIHIDGGQRLSRSWCPSCSKRLLNKEQAQLVITGKQSIDTDNNQVAQMLAALLDWPQATFASDVKLKTKSAGGAKSMVD